MCELWNWNTQEILSSIFKVARKINSWDMSPEVWNEIDRIKLVLATSWIKK